MLWAFLVPVATGLVFGFLFRVPAVLATSVAIAGLSVAVGLLAGVPFAKTAVVAVMVICAHQCAYLSGLLLHCAWTRARSELASHQWLPQRLALFNPDHHKR